MGKAALGVVAVFAAGLTCGCSFIFVSSPPEHPEKVPPNQSIDCTSGKAAPIIDTVIAGYELFRTGYALAQKDSDYANFPINRTADASIGVALSVLFIASAGYGYYTTGECADAEEAHERLRREEWTPAPRRTTRPRPPTPVVPTAPAPLPPAPTSPAPAPSEGPAHLTAPLAPFPEGAAPSTPPAPAPSSAIPGTGRSSAPASAAFPPQ